MISLSLQAYQEQALQSLMSVFLKLQPEMGKAQTAVS